MKTILRTTLLLFAVAAPAAAQDDTWNWRKAVAAGKTVEIRNIIGRIRATPATGNEVEIVARKTERSGDASAVRIEVDEHADGVTVCAIYDNRSSCDSDRHRGDGNRDNDTRVDFEVRIPRGVKFTGSNVSGGVEATGLDARVRASTVSGSVRVSTSDIASASSVSGSLRVRMGRSDWTGKLGFSTVSGDIELEFTDDLNADVEMSTVSGDLNSDWPISTSASRRHNIRGRIGSGGRELSFSTVSGSVDLRKAQ
jgi:Putative adhesin